jgi:peptidyl-prolyl cis-trans isomerase D
VLQNIRDRLTGPLVWFIVGIIVIPFAFFGIETLRTGGGDPTVAKVGDQKITQSQFRAGSEQRMQPLQSLMGENFRPDLIDQARFRQSVLDDMVQESLLRQHVRKAGYRASDAAIFETLSTIPAFQENGKFSTEAYRNRLSARGYTPARFEAQLRDSLVIEQMREGILGSAFVTDAAAALSYRLDQQQRSLAYALFETSRYLPQVRIDDTQVQEAFDAQKTRFQSPERLRVTYVELALDALPEAVPPTAEYLRSIYESEKATRFSTPEERRARHILINFGADKAAAKKRLEALAEKINKGTTFASFASSHSEDPGSKSKGGDLGWIKRGQMLEKFEQALFSLSPGEISEPVETEFGWHLIKLEELRAARTEPFEDPAVQADLLKIYRRRDSERRFQELSEKLEQIAFESPASLEPAVKGLGLELKVSGWFTRAAGDGIAAQAPIREAAFSEDVLGAGENSRPLPAGDNRVVVLRKHEYEAPRQKALDEVASTIREELKLKAARAQAESEAAAAQAALNEGHPLELAARSRGAVFKMPGLVRRSGAAGVDGKILETLFRMPHPRGGKPSSERVILANGDVALIASTAVEDAEWTTAPEADQRREAARLRDAAAGAEFAAYRTDLQKRIDVKIIEQPAAEADPAP